MDAMLYLVVGTPLVSAFLSYLIGRKNKAARDFFVLAACGVTFVFTLALWLNRRGCYVETNSMVLGLSLLSDHFRSLYAMILSLMWTVTSAFSLEYFSEHYRNRNRYYFFLLLTLGAALGVFLSADLMTAFVFFEILSLTSFVWVIHDETEKADRAAKTYLAVAVIGGLILFMGLGMLQKLLGTLTISELKIAAEGVENRKELYTAGVLVLLGFGAKAGMFPLHIWLPKAHPVAPAPASALLSGALTKIGVYGVLAISATVFWGDRNWGNTLLVLAVITMFLGALLAVFSVDLKRTLACSSMSQIGFVLVGVALASALGEENSLAATGAIDHMMNHSILKLALFMGAGAVYMNLHKLNLNDIRGFGRGKPILAVVFACGGLGLGGIPLFNGFLSKTMLHEAITEYQALTGSWALHAVEWIFMLTGGMTLAYMTKLFVCLFIDKPEGGAVSVQKRRYITPLTEGVLLGSALLVPILGQPAVMQRMVYGTVAFAGAEETASPAFWSWEALKGGLITVIIASLIYFGLIRTFLIKKGRYADLWPAKLDLEDSLYRPLLLKLLPAFFGGIAKALAELPDRIFIALPLWLGVFFRGIAELPDRIILLLRRSVFREIGPRTSVHIGDPVAEAAGEIADRVTHSNRYVLIFARRNRCLLEQVRQIGSGFSFALLLASLGLVITLFGLLLF